MDRIQHILYTPAHGYSLPGKRYGNNKTKLNRMITLQDIITVDNFKCTKPFNLTRMQLVILIFLNEILIWTNQHNQKDEVPELAKIDEQTFTEIMIEKIEEKIAYFKKIGIG